VNSFNHWLHRELIRDSDRFFTSEQNSKWGSVQARKLASVVATGDSTLRSEKRRSAEGRKLVSAEV